MRLRDIGGETPEIGVAIIGMGSMGKGLVFQSRLATGVRCVAVCDLEVTKCTAALCALGLAHVIVETPAELRSAIRDGVIAVCRSADPIVECPAVDVVLEASSGVASALGHCIAALENRKHLVLMNAEVDLTFGPLLLSLAGKHGVVLSSCGGDQHGVLKELLDDILFWGFRPVMAGNIKGFLDRYANPESIVAEADARNLDYRMCTAYTDGSKLNIEMAILANALDMKPVRPGMTGPRLAHVEDVFGAYDFASFDGGRPVVDYILGAEPAGGVFVVGYSGDPFQEGMLAYYKMGNGPYYLFYRPFHLCHIEGFDAVIAAARFGKALLQPAHGFRTNVYARAKRDIAAGEVLDGLGGFTVYGLIESVEDDAREPGIPVCLTEGAVAREPIARDEKVRLSALDHDPDRPDFAAYRRALAVGGPHPSPIVPPPARSPG